MTPRSGQSRSSCSARWKSTTPSSSLTRTSSETRAGGTRAPASTPCRRSSARWSQAGARAHEEDALDPGHFAPLGRGHHRGRTARLARGADGDVRRAVLLGDEPTGVDAIVFGALATSVLTPIESPIRDFLRSQPACVAYAERMRARFFPELAAAHAQEGAGRGRAAAHAQEGAKMAEHRAACCARQCLASPERRYVGDRGTAKPRRALQDSGSPHGASAPVGSRRFQGKALQGPTHTPRLVHNIGSNNHGISPKNNETISTSYDTMSREIRSTCGAPWRCARSGPPGHASMTNPLGSQSPDQLTE